MLARRTSRVAVVSLVAAATAALTALPAAAHVTVHPSSEPAGTSYSPLTFRVPNETDDASTVKLEVILPTDTPLIGILVKPVAGWQVHTKSIKLKTPVQTDDGPLTTAVSRIIWSGGSIPVGGYQDFDISVGHVPDQPGTLTFKALQTYSDGTVVRWIETAPEGSPEPEHPAPTLQLTAATAAPAGDHAAPVSEAASASSSNGTDRGLAIAALVVAVIAAGAAAAGLRRRSGS